MKIYNLSDLPKMLNGKSRILMSEVPKPFREDLSSFIIGETLMPHPSGEICIGEGLFNKWLNKVYQKGFDFNVDLKMDD
jgi:hypothetical protein